MPHRDPNTLMSMGAVFGMAKQTAQAVVPTQLKDWIYIFMVAGTLIYGGGIQVERINQLEKAQSQVVTKVEIDVLSAKWDLLWQRQQRQEELLLKVIAK